MTKAQGSAQGMAGKTVVITGASNGIGKETAVALARMGARVVMVARDQARGEQALADVKQRSGSQAVELALADLASLQSVRALASELLARCPRIDVLINNAGAVNDTRIVTVDGYETTFAVNHLAHFLLTNLLLERLKASVPARIINVSSEAHRMAGMNFDDLMGEKSYATFTAYGQSKLANILFTVELASRLQGSGVTVNALHPGVVATGFGHNSKGIFRHLVKLGTFVMINSEKGARTSVYLATSDEGGQVTGKYFAKSKQKRPTAAAQDTAAAARLWELSEKLVSSAASNSKVA